MLAKLNAFALVGIDAVRVEAEVEASAGMPKTVLVGLPEMAVCESVHRVERALASVGYDRHPGRTVINLAPADLRKDAGGFDLPIALGLLVATGQLLPEQLQDFATAGELALDGSLRPVKGALSVAMAAGGQHIKKLLVPAANAREAAVVESVEVYDASSLALAAVGIRCALVAPRSAHAAASSHEAAPACKRPHWNAFPHPPEKAWVRLSRAPNARTLPARTARGVEGTRAGRRALLERLAQD